MHLLLRSQLWKRTIALLIMFALALSGLLTYNQSATAASSPGRLLVIVDDSYTANPFGRYLAEILRAEGFASFDTRSVSELSAALLDDYPAVLLAEMSLTNGQSTILQSYVASGGNLVAMRPDAQLAPLFGWQASGTRQDDGFLKIDTATSAGAGLPSRPMQIHGVIDRYILNGGTEIANLYTGPNSPSMWPAVVRSSYGSGKTAAFAYDLSRSVVLMRQGNPANSDYVHPTTERRGDVDGDGVARTVDLFIGQNGTAPWVDLDRVDIPQADEQMRLLTHIITDMLTDAPLPRVWYFPNNAMTMLVLTGDAHGQPVRPYYEEEIKSIEARGGTITLYLSIAQDPPETNRTPGQEGLDAATWRSHGHAFGIHPYWNKQDGYQPYSSKNLQEGYTAMDLWWNNQGYMGNPSRTVRHHQVAWEGWTDAAQVAVAHRMSMDTNFYHWGQWLRKSDGTWARGYITGSGLPMKFMASDGTLIPLYQQLTQFVDEQMVNESGSGYEGLTPQQAVAVTTAQIDRSLNGDYAALMTQFHLDYYQTARVWAEGTMDYAVSKNVPIWNADQWLYYTETRDATRFTDTTWNAATGQLSFTVGQERVPTPTNANLTLMVPVTHNGRALDQVRVNGTPVATTTKVIKSRRYAFVSVAPGTQSVVASYAVQAPTLTPTALPTDIPTRTPTAIPTTAPTVTNPSLPTSTDVPTAPSIPTAMPTSTANPPKDPEATFAQVFLPLVSR